MPQNSLEQEALDRVARMYSSYDRPREQRRPQRPPGPQRPQGPPPEDRPEPPERPPEKPPEHPPEPPRAPEKPTGLLNMLMEDKEQSLIMLLLIILMKDGADLNLILALLYLVI